MYGSFTVIKSLWVSTPCWPTLQGTSDTFESGYSIKKMPNADAFYKLVKLIGPGD